MKKIICPKCGKEAKRKQTKYGIKTYCCNVWSWGENPLVDRKTHRARAKAHQYFDIIWKKGFMNRSQAYMWLAKSLNITNEECHMKKLNYKQCKRIINICKHFKTFTDMK